MYINILTIIFWCFLGLFIALRDPNATGEKMNPFAEQEAWEEHQIGKYHVSIKICYIVFGILYFHIIFNLHVLN